MHLYSRFQQHFFLSCPFSSKNATNNTDSGSKFVFGQNMSERVLVSWQSLFRSETAVCLKMFELWAASKVQLCCAFRVPRRVSPWVRKIKKLHLPLLQNPHHRKPPQRRVKTHIPLIIKNMLLLSLKIVRWLYSSDDNKAVKSNLGQLN